MHCLCPINSARGVDSKKKKTKTQGEIIWIQTLSKCDHLKNVKNDNIQVFHLSITVVWKFLIWPHYWLCKHILKETSFTHTYTNTCLCVCASAYVCITTQNVLQKICRQATTLPQLQALRDEVPQIAYWTTWSWEIPPGQNICDKNYLKNSYKDFTRYQPVFHQSSRNSTTISSITTYWSPTPGWG